jgi:hypothetical protein
LTTAEDASRRLDHRSPLWRHDVNASVSNASNLSSSVGTTLEMHPVIHMIRHCLALRPAATFTDFPRPVLWDNGLFATERNKIDSRAGDSGVAPGARIVSRRPVKHHPSSEEMAHVFPQ